MSRIKEKKLRRIERFNKLKIKISFTIIIGLLSLFLYSGLYTVNSNNRSILLLEEKKILSFNFTSGNEYNISFMGNNYGINPQKITNLIEESKSISNDSINKIKTIIYEKSQFLKKSLYVLTKN